MPFLLNELQQKSLQFPIVLDPITRERLLEYQRAFTSRYDRLAGYGFDFKEDCEIRCINPKCFYELVKDAPEGSYLVAQYICDDSSNNFKNMRLAFCIKIPVEGAADDLIHKDEIFDEKGNPIEFNVFVELACNYLKRKAIINKRAKLECQWDREGRAHQLDTFTKDLIRTIIIDSHGNLNNLYAGFILDNHLNEQETLSVYFFSDINIANPSGSSEVPAGYNHGTACCPIGR